MREQGRDGEEQPEGRVGDEECWDAYRERFADEELLGADRGNQDWLERGLLALADDRVRGEGRGRARG